MCISHQKTGSSNGRLMINLKNEYSYKVPNPPEHSNIWESQLGEISGGTSAKNIILGNIYRKTVNDYYIFFPRVHWCLRIFRKLRTRNSYRR